MNTGQTYGRLGKMPLIQAAHCLRCRGGRGYCAVDRRAEVFLACEAIRALVADFLTTCAAVVRLEAVDCCEPVVTAAVRFAAAV
jgi:hypothetical protein